MKIKWTVVGVLITMALLGTACGVLRGSGEIISESRDVSGFDRVDVSGSAHVIISQGNEETLTVETDDNIMEHVVTEVRGNTLYLSLENDQFSDISPTRLTFDLTVDDLASLTVSGSASVEAKDLEADSLEINIDGSGEVKLEGEVAQQDIVVSGSGRYDGSDLAGKTVEVHLDGSGQATVWASESLEADASGSGSVDYYGNPETSVLASDSGHINSLGDK